ncbi:DegV domain-containing protein SAV1425 [Aedoeadaptatus ivorii]|uniref:DegV domain-containing protein SAV1425 n=1 Tax=Aedoeadaptatus ivorii TaxID=54006 RepID=A0A3S4ZPT9_9FIRM|nr:DegV family protein [Peptoniphilus ivorii]VEJ34662.1 DegV domain-containing protein SAV1425 [Peptoniphilus ivorii]
MTKIRIIADTSADFTREEAEAIDLIFVPFTIEVGGKTYVDDYDVDIDAMYKDMAASKDPIRTACPSPYHYETALEEADADAVFVVTISSKLSGSYNAAYTAVERYKREHPDRKVALIDSKSASAGTANVVDRIASGIEKGADFDEILRDVERYVDEQTTFFILETMDQLVKNGRVRKLTGRAMNALNVKPIMRSNDGNIELHQVNRGFKKSLARLGEHIVKMAKEKSYELITISHSEAEEKAKELKDIIAKEIFDVTIRIVHTKALASGYADFGGIVVAL